MASSANLEESHPVFKSDGNRMPKLEGTEFPRHQFGVPPVLSTNDLRQLGPLNQRFIQSLTQRLGSFLRMECVVNSIAFESVTYESFSSTLASPTLLNLFEIEPFRGAGILELPLGFVLLLTERLLGGLGTAPVEARELTDIELTLSEDAVRLILTEWTRHFQLDSGNEAHVIGTETSARFLQIAAAGAPMLVARIEITIANNVSVISLGVPVAFVEQKLQQLRDALRQPETPKLMQWRNPYNGINVPVIADWAVREITVREVLAFELGTIIDMPRELIDHTRIRFGSRPEFYGQVGIQNGRIAVQLTDRFSII